MKFPWRIVNVDAVARKQREAEDLAQRQQDLWMEACKLADSLEEKIVEREDAERAALEKLSVMRRYFDRLVVLVPRLNGAKANCVSLFVPAAVLKALRSEGRDTQEQFAVELARRLVQRALQELWDSPQETTHISTADLSQ